MRCMRCDNAVEFFCTADNCDWNYITPFNQYNSRYEQNIRNKPSWMTDEIEFMNYPSVEGIRFRGDSDD